MAQCLLYHFPVLCQKSLLIILKAPLNSLITVKVLIFKGVNFHSVWGGGGRSVTIGERSPRCFFWVIPKRSIPKPYQHRKDIIQQESLGTDMLQELKNSNYTRYHIELINRSCGGWLVATML